MRREVLYLHGGLASERHPSQPHSEDSHVRFETSERSATFLEVAHHYKDKGVCVELWEQPALRSVLELVHPAEFLENFAATCQAAGSDPRLFGEEVYVNEYSFDAARIAVGCAIEGVNRIIRGECIHVVCGGRPSGHHAMPSRSMGFCCLSTAAIAALYARDVGRRVCVFDYDAHSGNGTIEGVIGKAGVLFAEIRTMTMDAFHTPVPSRAYPYPRSSSVDPRYWFEYRPAGGNLVLEDMFLGATGDDYVDRFTRSILPAIEGFSPSLLIISAGFDCMRGDPLGDLGLERRHISRLVRSLVGLGVPSVTVIEGGYEEGNNREGLSAHLEELLVATSCE